MTWSRGRPATTLTPLAGADLERFCRSLEDTPPHADLLGSLRVGGSRLFADGASGSYRAALIDNGWDPDEPMALGNDAAAIWGLLRRYSGWTCVGGLARPVAEDLAGILRRELGTEPFLKAAVLFVLARPAVPFEAPGVRLLTPDDAEQVDRAPPEILGPHPGGSELLDRATVAAVFAEDEIVGWMISEGRTPLHAGVGGHVREPFRNRGLGSAAAYLVAREVQRTGRSPVWSTGEDNPRSQHVARKLGFEECGRDWYVVVPEFWDRGGFAPAGGPADPSLGGAGSPPRPVR